MNNCSQYFELISAMIDGELETELESELRTHLEHCDECKRVYNAFKEFSNALSKDFVRPPEILSKSIMQRVNKQKKGTKKPFIFGRFTAVAACLALILLGASRFGFFDGLNNNKQIEKSSLRSADIGEMVTNSDHEEFNTQNYSSNSLQENTNDSSEQIMIKGDINETEEDVVFQFGFPTQNTGVNGTNIEDIQKEPLFLFEAKELSIYEGKYSSNDEQKNKLLFTVKNEEELTAFSELLTAVPEGTTKYEIDDDQFVKSNPKYTVYIPADKDKNSKINDKMISIWYINEEIWGVIQDVRKPTLNVENTKDFSIEKILYKALGSPNKCEDFIKKLGK